MTTIAKLHNLLADLDRTIGPLLAEKIAEHQQEAERLTEQLCLIRDLANAAEPSTNSHALDLAIAALEEFPPLNTRSTTSGDGGTTVYFSDSPRPDDSCYVPATRTIHVVRELLKAERNRRKEQA